MKSKRFFIISRSAVKSVDTKQRHTVQNACNMNIAALCTVLFSLRKDRLKGRKRGKSRI